MTSHKHEWLKTMESIEAVYPLKKNTGGVKEIRVNSPAYVCYECESRAIKSPWTGAMVELVAQ